MDPEEAFGVGRGDVVAVVGAGGKKSTLYALAASIGRAVLTATVEVGSARAQRGVDDEKIREPARGARPFYLTAAVLAVGLLVVSGLLGMPPSFL